jgi:hypothetical protein
MNNTENKDLVRVEGIVENVIDITDAIFEEEPVLENYVYEEDIRIYVDYENASINAKRFIRKGKWSNNTNASEHIS